MAKVENDEIYSVSELAKASGFGRQFLYDRIAEGSLKARPFGKRMLKIKGKDFLEWFDAQPLKSENIDSSEEDENTDGKSNGPEKRDIATGVLTSMFR